MNTRTLHGPILAGIASTFAATAHAQDQAARATSGELGIHYEVHGDLAAGGTPFLLLHGGMGSIESDFGALHVVGFSMGGMLAIELGIAAPDRIETLTAISVSQNLDGMHPAIAEMNRNPGSAPSPEALELLPTEEDFAEMKAAFAENPDGPEQFERTFGQLQSFMVSGWGWSAGELASIEAPTLIALGDRDFIPVAHGAWMAETTGAQLAVLPDTTHLSILKRADWLAPLIANRIATADE